MDQPEMTPCPEIVPLEIPQAGQVRFVAEGGQRLLTLLRTVLPELVGPQDSGHVIPPAPGRVGRSIGAAGGGRRRRLGSEDHGGGDEHGHEADERGHGDGPAPRTHFRIRSPAGVRRPKIGSPAWNRRRSSARSAAER